MKQIKNLLQKELEKYEHMEKQLVEAIEEAPRGNLRVSMCRKYPQYYHCTERGSVKGNYIRKSDAVLAQQLAQKDYDIKIREVLRDYIACIQQMIQMAPNRRIEDVCEKMHPARKVLIQPYFITDKEYRENWEKVSYDGKSFPDNFSEIYTEKGERVRSKSEKIIADKLYAMGIPYRYEYPLQLRNYGTVYPDFTLLNTRTREEYYLEHFGMMDDPNYASKMVQKLETYQRNGIYPGEKLLITYETSEMMCDMRLVQCLFEKYLL